MKSSLPNYREVDEKVSGSGIILMSDQVEELHQKGVRKIIFLAEKEITLPVEADFAEKGIEFVKVPMREAELDAFPKSFKEKLYKVRKEISECKGRVHLFCIKGMTRTGGALINYLVSKKVPLSTAVELAGRGVFDPMSNDKIIPKGSVKDKLTWLFEGKKKAAQNFMDHYSGGLPMGKYALRRKRLRVNAVVPRRIVRRKK